MLCGSVDRREFGREWICMAESLRYSPEIITILLIGYTPIENNKFKVKKEKKKEERKEKVQGSEKTNRNFQDLPFDLKVLKFLNEMTQYVSIFFHYIGHAMVPFKLETHILQFWKVFLYSDIALKFFFYGRLHFPKMTISGLIYSSYNVTLTFLQGMVVSVFFPFEHGWAFVNCLNQQNMGEVTLLFFQGQVIKGNMISAWTLLSLSISPNTYWNLATTL